MLVLERCIVVNGGTRIRNVSEVAHALTNNASMSRPTVHKGNVLSVRS
jgi:hypothetical protein